MNNTLQFNGFIQEYLIAKIPNPNNNEEVEIIDVKLNKPTEKVNILITNATIKQLEIKKKIAEGVPVYQEEQMAYLDILEDLVFYILNNNRTGLRFSKEYVSLYFGDVDKMTTLITGMAEFINKIKQRKN